MRQLAFKQVYIDPILQGAKTTTLRRNARVAEGDLVNATCRRGHPPFAVLRVRKVHEVRIDDLTDGDAMEDGFVDREDLKKAISDIYPEADRLFRIVFSLEEPSGAT